jgi:hypothetical protein
LTFASHYPRSLAAWLMAFCLLVLGCSGQPSRAYPPAYSSSAGADAIAAYDANRDGSIHEAELDRVPALRSALGQVDADNNGRITAQEIDDRIKNWLSLKIAEMPVRCEVSLDGAPLADAQVVLEPEPFQGTKVHSAQGTTVEDGSGGISMSKEHLADSRYPGVACGWYKIRVTSASRTIPARYNTETTLGCEVAMNAEWVNHGAVELKLQSQ